jgi:hypothetical protein
VGSGLVRCCADAVLQVSRAHRGFERVFLSASRADTPIFFNLGPGADGDPLTGPRERAEVVLRAVNTKIGLFGHGCCVLRQHA